MAKKAKVVKAKVSKAKPKKRMSKGVKLPWEVWSLPATWATMKVTGKFHTIYEDFATEVKAKACIKKNPDLVAPVIRHVDIPPVEY